MAMSETLVEDSYSAIEGDTQTAHVLSDSRLALHVRKANGSNWDHEIYDSYDGGATWTQRLTIVTNVNVFYIGNWIGDSLYLALAPQILSTAMAFIRVDYTVATQTFSVGQSGTNIRASSGTTYYGIPAFDKEPGGRLWCAYKIHNGTQYQLNLSYSDDNGASWTTSTSVFGSEEFSQQVDIFCLEKNTVVIWSKYQTGVAGTYRTKKLHTDGVNSWAGESQIISLTYSAGNPPDNVGVKQYALPCKRAFIVAKDNGNSPKRAKWVRLDEDSGGTLTFTQGSTFISAPAAEGQWFGISGRTDGAWVYYQYSGSLGTMRRRTWAIADSDWNSESTWALTNTVRSLGGFSATGALNMYRSLVEEKHLVFFGKGTAGSFRPVVITQDLAASGNFQANRLIPLSYLTQVAADRIIPVFYAGKQTFDRVIPLEYYVTNLILVDRVIPLWYATTRAIDRIVPVYYQQSPIFIADRIIPLLYVTTLAADRVIPIYYQTFEDWVREIGPEAEAYLAEIAAQVDEWVKEEGLGVAWGLLEWGLFDWGDEVNEGWS